MWHVGIITNGKGEIEDMCIGSWECGYGWVIGMGEGGEGRGDGD